MPQLVLFPTELTCMQLTGFEIDLVHKHYNPPPPGTKAITLYHLVVSHITVHFIAHLIQHPTLQGNF
jgi:hypothetical protein